MIIGDDNEDGDLDIRHDQGDNHHIDVMIAITACAVNKQYIESKH